MYLRFYKQTEENIDKCIAEMKPFMIGLTEIKKKPITLSTNIFLPKETETEKNVEVELVFKTSADEKKMHANKNCFAIYQKYCSPIKGAEAVARKVGDIATKHR